MLWLCKFCRKIFFAKAAHKMLMSICPTFNEQLLLKYSHADRTGSQSRADSVKVGHNIQLSVLGVKLDVAFLGKSKLSARAFL